MKGEGVSSSYSSVGQSVRLITVRSAVQARVGASYLLLVIFPCVDVFQFFQYVLLSAVGFEPTRT